MTDDVYDAPLIDPEEPKAPQTPDEIAAEAQKTFSLTERLRGIKHREGKVILYTDLQAVDAYQAVNDRARTLADQLGRVGLADKRKALDAALEGNGAVAGSAEQETIAFDIASTTHAELTARFEEVEVELEAARAEMLKGALVVRMRAFPMIAADVARRKALKRFVDPAIQQVPHERVQQFSDYIDSLLFGQTVLEVVDASGAKMDLGKRSSLFYTFKDTLPPSQWLRLYDEYLALTQSDQISQQATEEPGF